MSAIKYRVNEIFYSLQAEGMNAGRPAVFVRLAGCNLKCPFCDTDHTKGEEYTKEELEAKVAELDPSGMAIVVITGGEPTIQLKAEERLFANRFVAMETNGIIMSPCWVDHVTISPKTKLTPEQLGKATEIKVLHGWFDEAEMRRIENIARALCIRLYIQPTANARGKFDPAGAMEFAKAHPCWTLSLQWHKLFNIR